MPVYRLRLYPSNQRDINVKVVDERLGLSHQSVNCFWEDEFGFMWIGTQNGLNRFDGYEVETFCRITGIRTAFFRTTSANCVATGTVICLSEVFNV